jgi:hypothetical protein
MHTFLDLRNTLVCRRLTLPSSRSRLPPSNSVSQPIERRVDSSPQRLSTAMDCSEDSPVYNVGVSERDRERGGGAEGRGRKVTYLSLSPTDEATLLVLSAVDMMEL